SDLDARDILDELHLAGGENDLVHEIRAGSSMPARGRGPARSSHAVPPGRLPHIRVRSRGYRQPRPRLPRAAEIRGIQATGPETIASRFCRITATRTNSGDKDRSRSNSSRASWRRIPCAGSSCPPSWELAF